MFTSVPRQRNHACVIIPNLGSDIWALWKYSLGAGIGREERKGYFLFSSLLRTFFFHFFCLFSCSSSFENNSIHDNCDKRSKRIESITFTSTIRQAPRDVVIPLAYCTMPTSSETRARFFGAIRSGMYFPLRRREREREFESIGLLFQ